jgi:outer membrane protein assembly factor BamB
MKSSSAKVFVSWWLMVLIWMIVSNLVAGETNYTAWPNWMGPHHDGISSEAGWSTDWSEEGLPLVWKQTIGIGFSSVAIADGRLFTMGHVDGQEFVYSFDAITGKSLWSYAYDAPLVDNLHEGGPGSTPTVDGEFVYTLGRAGQFICFRVTTGQVLWTRQFQEDLGIALPEWGFTSSPYVLGNQLIFEAGRVVSYDKTSGKKNWQTDKHQPGYGSATCFSSGGKSMLATLDCDGLRVVRARDGHEVAFAPWSSPYRTNSTTPIVDGDLLFISTGYNVGCGLFRLENNELEMVYQNREMRNHFNNCILLDGYLYGFDGNSNLGRLVHLKCMDFETGEVVWEKEGFGCGSLMIVDGKLIVLSEAGELVVADATPDGYREFSRTEFLSGRCWTVPVLCGGAIYGRDAAGDLRCVKLPPASH